MSKKYLIFITLSALFSAVLTANAQDSSGKGASVLEEIIVTANRRETGLQDVPISVTAVTADELERAGISNARDLARIIPNFTHSNSAGVTQPRIRGVGSTLSDVGSEAGISLYVDGVYIPDQAVSFQDLFAVDHIEVLRGPQGTLFGRNSTGGLINIITKTPSHETGGKLSVSYGNYGALSTKGYFTTGLTDKLAVDISGVYTQGDGWIDDEINGGEINEYDSLSVRTKFVYDLSDTARISGSLTHEDRDDPTDVSYHIVNNNAVGQDVPGAIVGYGPHNSASSVGRESTKEATRADIQTHFEFGNLNLETTSSWSQSEFTFLTDLDHTSVPIQHASHSRKTQVTTNEIRLFSSNDTFDWIVGAYYFDSNGSQPRPTTIFVGPTNIVAVALRPGVDSTSYAAFGEGTYHITEDLSLVMGIRYTSEDLDFIQTINGAQLFDTSTSNSKWTPRVTLRYQINDKVSVYGTYSEGFKSGAYNAAGASPDPVEPEELEAWEIGLKSEPTDWLRVNASLFTYDYTNLQLTSRDPVLGTFTLRNAAEAEMEGGEIELYAQPTDRLNVRAALAYLDATFSSFPGAQGFTPIPSATMPGFFSGNTSVTVDATGNQLPVSPKTSGSIGVTYIQPVSMGDVGFSADVFFSSKVYWDAANTQAQSSYSTVNAELFWEPSENLRLALWGTNLTDKVILERQYAANNEYARARPPRMFGITASYDF